MSKRNYSIHSIKMMMTGTPEQVNRVNQATLKMKKLELAELQIAYKGQ